MAFGELLSPYRIRNYLGQVEGPRISRKCELRRGIQGTLLARVPSSFENMNSALQVM